ncbi:hypothetical protein [Iodobacter ciconiae]|uniref:hypothetical protein n=1 Tax=Iodobacter ciconiae TaxID=2496266 RepID=UPI0013E0AA4C|nr:hypothetical protein [Iodobacter ciconiae]
MPASLGRLAINASICLGRSAKASFTLEKALLRVVMLLALARPANADENSKLLASSRADAIEAGKLCFATIE